MKHFRDGANIVAMNIQTVELEWYLNRAVFLPQTGVACTAKEIKTDQPDCKKSWKNNKTNARPLAYRIKPLWLLGLYPHPGMYKLTVKLLSVVQPEYDQISITYGLNETKKSVKMNENIVIENIDPTVPFFKLALSKSMSTSKYVTGCEFVWSHNKIGQDQLVEIEVYKIEKTIMGNYNAVNVTDNCETSSLFTWRKSMIAKLQYKYELLPTVVNYNVKVDMKNIINKLKESPDFKGKTTKEILLNNELLHRYQVALKKEVIKDTVWN